MHGLALIGLLAGSFAVTALARRLGWSPPLVLVVVGLAVSYVPGLPDYEIDPELVLLLILPPLLYSAALGSSYLRIRDDTLAIGLLAVGLVLFTTVVVGLVAWWLVPGLPLAAAFVLGAVVAPPDAVAATAVGRRLGLPRRLMTILSGESLVNDATALTAYRLAVAVAAGATYTVWQGVGLFLLAALGGVVVGWALGWLVHRVRLALRDGVLESAAGLIVPFAAYLVAEQVHASGVIAVVVCGLYLGHHAPSGGPAARLQEQAVWKAADTLLESLVFALIGLQVRGVVDAIDHDLGTLLLIGLALLGVTILARIVWVFPSAHLTGFLPGARGPAMPWQWTAIVSWAGMRGVVSLAAAFAIPLTTDSGEPFPGRDAILFLAFTVTVGTLLVQGLTLPVVIRALGVRSEESMGDALAEAAAKQDAGRAALGRLDELVSDDPLHATVTAKLRHGTQARSNTAWERLGRPTPQDSETPSTYYKRVRREMLAAERAVFVRHRDDRRIDDDVFRRVQRELDLEESMLDRE